MNNTYDKNTTAYMAHPGYLYKLLGDHIEEYSGNVYIFNHPRVTSEVYFEDKGLKRIPCSPEPGKIFADGVWFEKPSLEKAIDIFVQRMTKEMFDLDLKRRALYDDIASLLVQKMEAKQDG